MFILNQKYITDKFNLPGTNTFVILNGVYQPQLSFLDSNLIFEGEVLNIPKNTKLKTPIHLLFLTSQDCCHSIEIIAEENSYATIIEEYASLGEKPYINEIKIHVAAKLDSEIVHRKLQFEDSARANHQAIVSINQTAGSKITSNFISKGAKIAKDMLHVKLVGENASYNMRGINLLRGNQNMSNQIYIEHLKPGCTSNILSKSIVDEQGVNNFDCRVTAYGGATKTETHVTNKNLLLSELATANTSPKLEIYVDDVVCTHGATVGQLDEEALFYLLSRGIERNMAIKILVSAFVKDITDQFTKYNRYKIAAGLVHD